MTQSRFIHNAKEKRGEIFLYDPIGESFWSDGMSAKRFQKELEAMGDVTHISLYVNSPGGDVFDGTTIYNLLLDHPAKVEAEVQGIAASIASVIVQAADKIIMAENSMYMIHNASAGMFGQAKDFRKLADVLDQIRENIIKSYQRRVSLSNEEIIALLDEETWMDAVQAKELGFIDDVKEAMKVAACADLDRVAEKLKFQKMPQDLAERLAPPLTYEQQLRHQIEAMKDGTLNILNN